MPSVSFLFPTSLCIVAIVAVHGTYSRQNTMREYAFAALNPIAPSVATKLSMPWDVVIFCIPKSTLQLDTTTSFAAIPEISATTICQ